MGIKCVIAAGGLGTRLQGFRDNDKTKVLLEVNSIPMINQQINQLNQWGVEEFVIITNPNFDSLIREVTSQAFPDLIPAIYRNQQSVKVGPRPITSLTARKIFGSLPHLAYM